MGEMMGMTEGEHIAALTVQVQHLTTAVERLDAAVARLTTRADRWRGGFLVVLALGGIMGWLVALLAGMWTR